MLFFFFKQKTAYELRISDWSSDVCSSDLDRQDADGAHQCDGLALHPGGFPPHSSLPSHLCPQCPSGFSTTTFTVIVPLVPKSNVRSKESPSAIGRFRSDRSEEHTSELQSLMRISYAVFCLKKKNHNNNT